MSDSYRGKREEPAKARVLGNSLRLVLLLVFFVLPLLGGCKPQEEKKTVPVALEPVVLCRGKNMHLPLVVAEKQGLFSEQGLAVTVREFIVGRDALDAMLKGECDLATSAEPPVVEYVLQGRDLRILCSMQSSDNLVRIAARADRDIAAPADLRGKRIATVKGTAPHCFLEMFFEKHRLTPDDVTLVFMKSDEVLAALISGQVDAIAMPNNVIAQAQQALQAKAVSLEAPGLCRNYVMVLATSGLQEKRPGVAVKFLRALAQAEDFINQRPEEAQVVAQADQKISAAEFKHLLELFQYQLTLDHALLMGLEEAARWTLRQSGDGQGAVPNFLNLITAEPLQSVNPDGVKLEK